MGSKRLALGVLLSVGVGLAAFAVMRLARPSPCDELATELCTITQKSDCTRLRKRLSWIEPDNCGAALALIRRAEPAAKLPLAEAAVKELRPGFEAVQRAMAKLPPERAREIKAKLGARALTDEMHDSLVDEIVTEAE